jgi:hypothetical protein
MTRNELPSQILSIILNASQSCIDRTLVCMHFSLFGIEMIERVKVPGFDIWYLGSIVRDDFVAVICSEIKSKNVHINNEITP